MSKTLGEFRVRTDFNVTGSSYVDEIKAGAAALINKIDSQMHRMDLDEDEALEWRELKQLSIRNIELGAMWAVKAATI
jgi:hypothetical protein